MFKIQPFSRQMVVESIHMNLHTFQNIKTFKCHIRECICEVLKLFFVIKTKTHRSVLVSIIAYKTTCKTSYLFIFYLLRKDLVNFGRNKSVQDIFTFRSSNVQDGHKSPITFVKNIASWQFANYIFNIYLFHIVCNGFTLYIA